MKKTFILVGIVIFITIVFILTYICTPDFFPEKREDDRKFIEELNFAIINEEEEKALKLIKENKNKILI